MAKMPSIGVDSFGGSAVPKDLGVTACRLAQTSAGGGSGVEAEIDGFAGDGAGCVEADEGDAGCAAVQAARRTATTNRRHA